MQSARVPVQRRPTTNSQLTSKQNSNVLQEKTKEIKELIEMFKQLENRMTKGSENKNKNDMNYLNSVNAIMSFVSKNQNNLAFAPKITKYDNSISQMLNDFESVKTFDFKDCVEDLEKMLDQNDIQIEKAKNLLINNLAKGLTE